MLRAAFIACLCMSAAARAQTLEPATYEEVGGEARYYADLEGPQPGTTRGVGVWRPPSAPDGLLPTVYVTDGGYGLLSIVAWLKPAIEQGLAPPVLVISMDNGGQYRTSEYVRNYRGGGRRFEAHERWMIERVIPWAERYAGASPTQRIVAGYSNGGDFALAMASAHPDLFVGVLAHAPVASESFDLDMNTPHMRWAVSAGRRERGGDVARIVSAATREISGHGSLVRTCLGPWDHEFSAWRDLSPGAILWLFAMPGAAEVSTLRERQHCRFLPQDAAPAPLDDGATRIINAP